MDESRAVAAQSPETPRAPADAGTATDDSTFDINQDVASWIQKENAENVIYAIQHLLRIMESRCAQGEPCQ
jgi:hypothetical protein